MEESTSAQSDLTKDRIAANKLNNVLQAQLTYIQKQCCDNSQ